MPYLRDKGEKEIRNKGSDETVLVVFANLSEIQTY